VSEIGHDSHGGEKMSWTEERVELLKRLWNEGLSASQIATKLSDGVTRNAVIGKVHRLNLSGRAPQPRSSIPRPVNRAIPAAARRS
jgi:GcrA cell cycle regulator